VGNQTGSGPLQIEMMGLGTHSHGRVYLKHRLGSRYLLWFRQVSVARKYMASQAGLHVLEPTTGGETHAPI